MRLYPVVIVLTKEHALFIRRQAERQKVFFCASESCRQEVIQIAQRHNSVYFLPTVDETLPDGSIQGGRVAAKHSALRTLAAPGVAQDWALRGAHELVDFDGKVFATLEVASR